MKRVVLLDAVESERDEVNLSSRKRYGGDVQRAYELSVRAKRDAVWRVAPRGRTRYFLLQP